MFTRMLQQARRTPEQFTELAAELFRAMAAGGRVGFEAVAWFNGGLFDDGAALPLEAADIETVIVALLTSKWGRSPGRSDQELCDLGRNRLIHGFFWDLPEQYFLASVDGRLRRPRSGWGACSAAAKSRRKVFNLWLLLDDRWAGDTAQVEPVR